MPTAWPTAPTLELTRHRIAYLRIGSETERESGGCAAGGAVDRSTRHELHARRTGGREVGA
jgi:hypothetical protein